VIGYQTDELPCFFSRESGINVPYRVETPKEIASIMKTKWDLGLQGGIFIANPIPKEYSLDFEEIDKTIENAIEEAKRRKIKGKELTPFLLSKINELTKGESLKANIELVYNNAQLGAEIAKEFNILS
jgi:pseudouridine-5'-phosphate glycosidase